MSERRRDPRPKDWDEYCAAMASNDSIRIAKAKAKYNAELIEAGKPPLYEPPEPLWKD